MESHSLDFALEQNLPEDESWARAVEAVENVVSSEEPLVAVPEDRGARVRKRRRLLAGPLGLSLFLVSGVAVAFVLFPAAPGAPGIVLSWQSAGR